MFLNLALQMISRLLTALISLLLLGGCTPHTTPSQSGEVSIAHLKSLCKGDHIYISGDYTLHGIVVATDWLGELNKSAIIVDSTGGLEFAIESSNINDILPIFSEVTINCNGLVLARVGSKIELGMPPTGDFPIDNINDEVFDHYIKIIGQSNNFAVPTKRFSEIGADDISNIVTFENVRICDEEQGLTWCNYEEGEPVTTVRTLIDRDGEQFEVRILSTCHYADEEIPTKEISVIGVIDYSDNRYFMRIVNESIF